MEKCPVCGMDVDANNPPATSIYRGRTYCFCCQECKNEFDQNPEQYAKP